MTYALAPELDCYVHGQDKTSTDEGGMTTHPESLSANTGHRVETQIKGRR